MVTSLSTRQLLSTFLMVLSSWCLTANEAIAASSPDLSADFLVDRASLIFTGTVYRLWYAESVDTNSGKNATHTFVEFSVDETLKGSTGADRLTLKMLGGRNSDGTRLKIIPAPSFELNSRYLVFVSDNGRSMVPFVGWSAGVLRFVSRTVDGAAFLTDLTGRPITGISDGRWKRMAMRVDGNGVPTRNGPQSVEPNESIEVRRPEKLSLEGVPGRMPTETPAPADDVVAEVRALIETRSEVEGFRSGELVHSITE